MLSHPVVEQTLPPTAPTAIDVAVYAVAFIVVAALARRRPSYGIAALTALVPFALIRDVGLTTIGLPKVALLATIAGLALRRCDIRVLAGPAAGTLLICAAAVCAATALSIAEAAYLGPALRETLKSLEYLVLFAAVVVGARADGDERPLRLAFASSALAVSCTAIADEVAGAHSVLLFAGHPIVRVAGVLEGPNQLAGYLGIALCVVAAFSVARPGALLERLALFAGVLALGLTLSRAGTIASLGGIALTIAVSRRTSLGVTLAPLGAGIFAACAVLAVPAHAAAHSFSEFLRFFARFSSVDDAVAPGAVGTRAQLWHAALTLWQRHPIFGIGAGNFEFELGRAGYPGLRTHANSLYLQALVEGGVPLLAATLALGWSSVARFARGPFREPLVAGALGAAAGFAAHQVFDLLVFFPKVGELWWIVLALGAARVDAFAPVAAPLPRKTLARA